MTNGASHTLRHAFSFLVGFLVRPCCSIPLALALFGLSGAGIAAALAPWRTVFLALAAAFFAVSFYFNFIRNRNRAGMIVWALSVAFSTVLLLGPALAARGPHRAGLRGEIPNMKTTEYQINGMACDACARRLQTALAKTAGVRDASVSFQEKRAMVSFDPGQISSAQIKQQIEATGFRAVDEK